MLSSHLPQMSWDKLVYDFLCGFWCIVGGYVLRGMCSHCLRASRNFLYGPLGAGRVNLYRLRRDCWWIRQSQCSYRVQSPTASAWKSYGAQRLRWRRWAEMVWWPCSRRTVFERAASTRCPCGDCAMPSMTLLQHVYGLWTYNFSNL